MTTQAYGTSDISARMTRRGFVGASALASLLLAGCSGTSEPSGGTGATTGTKSVPDAPTAQTAYGAVTGITDGGVSIWYGVPYGRAPEGELRWQPPEVPDSWSDARDCTQPAAVALQFANNQVTGTEDCLNLDVYAPHDARDLPVMVYIHGGNNQTGTAQEIPGKELAANDGIVYVSLSYRLGLLGFNCLPALGVETGNFALLDIARALDWVRSNIYAFGGDPNNVTVTGFSAGGRDVMCMLMSPAFQGRFDKAIAFSGGMTTAEVEPSQKKIATALVPLAMEDGKAASEQEAYAWLLSDGTDVRDWLYNLWGDRLAPLMGDASIRMSVFPHLYEDGVVIPKGGFKDASYHAVPLMMLTGATEFSLFSLGDPFWKGDMMSEAPGDVLSAAQDFAVRYGSDMYRIFNAECSAEQMADTYGSDIYVCQVDFGSASSAVHIDPYGAFHGIFVPMLSSTNTYTSLVPNTFDQDGYQAMAKAFNDYLKNFLMAGNPNGGDLATWDAWSNDEGKSMVFDATETDAVVGLKDVRSSYDQIIAAMDADETIDADTKLLVEQNDMAGRWFSSALDEHTGAHDLWQVPYEA